MRKLIISSLAIFPIAAYANVVWPALYLETRLFSWWAIGVGLIVEFFFIRWLFDLVVKRAAFAVVSANTLSAVLGLVLIPLVGIIWELMPGSVINWAFGWGTFNPITWIAAFLIGCLVNAVIEGVVYKKWFVMNFRFRSKQFGWLIIANAISVGAAFVSLWTYPVRI